MAIVDNCSIVVAHVCISVIDYILSTKSELPECVEDDLHTLVEVVVVGCRQVYIRVNPGKVCVGFEEPLFSRSASFHSTLVGMGPYTNGGPWQFEPHVEVWYLVGPLGYRHCV